MDKLFNETFVRADDCGSAYSADRTETTHIAWVDELSFTRDVIPRALLNSDNSFAITKFPTVKDCICHADRQFDAVLYHCHDEQFSNFCEVAMLSGAYPNAQIVLLSDSSTLDEQAFGKALKVGLRPIFYRSSPASKAL
jgi:hypothetical protein